MSKLKLNVEYRNRLRALMADAGFRSMIALAQETGISKNMLYMFERGESDLSLSNILRLLWVLDCRIDDLIQYEITSNEPTHVDALSEEVDEDVRAAREEYRAMKSKKRESA